MKSIFFTVFLLAVNILAACSGSDKSTAMDEIRQAEAAAALGDMEAAKNVASHIIGSKNLNELSASQLARLSLIYMRLADSIDNEGNIAQATDLYRRAYAVNADSASAYYSDVNPDYYPYVTMLRTLVGHLDHPYNPEADSIDEQHHNYQPITPDSL